MPGYKFCGVHGGPNPKNEFYGLGVGLTTGKGSNFKLTRLAAKAAEMERSGVLLTNRKSIDVVRERLSELLTRVDAREMGERLAVLYKLWGKYNEHLLNNEEVEALKMREAINQEFDKVYHDYNSWSQIMDVIDLDRKLVESEVKIAKDMQAMLTAEDAYELMAKVFAAIMRHVKDPMILKALQYEFTTIVGDGSVVEAEDRDGEDYPSE